MNIERIEDLGHFEELLSDWDRIYAADLHARVFLSWEFLRSWFEITPYRSMVVAVRMDDDG